MKHFDVCGMQEVKVEKDIIELTNALDNLTNEDWVYVFGVRTHRPSGSYHEAYAALWRRDRVQLGNGLIGDIWPWS